MNEIAKTVQYNQKEVKVSGKVIIRENGKTKDNLELRDLISTIRFSHNIKLKGILCQYISNIQYTINRGDWTDQSASKQFAGSIINNFKDSPARFFKTLCEIDKIFPNKGFNRFVTLHKQLLTFRHTTSKKHPDRIIGLIEEEFVSEEEIKDKNYIIINYAIVKESFINYFIWFIKKIFEKDISVELQIKKSRLTASLRAADINLFKNEKSFKLFVEEIKGWFEYTNNQGYENIMEYSEEKTKELLKLDLEKWLESIK